MVLLFFFKKSYSQFLFFALFATVLYWEDFPNVSTGTGRSRRRILRVWGLGREPQQGWKAGAQRKVFRKWRGRSWMKTITQTLFWWSVIVPWASESFLSSTTMWQLRFNSAIGKQPNSKVKVVNWALIWYTFVNHIEALFIERSVTMSEKRRDNRGRTLHNGGSQRQDGRYAYKYKDLNGETKSCTAGDWTRMRCRW